MSAIQNILIIGTVWPEPNSSAAGSRMIQLIELFLSQGWKTTFASAASDSDFMFDLKKSGIDKVNIELNNDSFDSFVSDLKPTIVLFDRFMTEEQYGWRVAENCPDALRILDTEDLHCLRLARQVAFKENRVFINADLVSDVSKREIASVLRCDLSLIVSTFEMDLIQNYFKVDSSLLHYLPFMLEKISDTVHLPKFENRKHFISIGNFLHEPNRDAVQYLKEEIWSLIRIKLPDAELHVYGAYPSQKVNALHKPKDGFFVMGRAEDAKEVMMNAKVCLAPLRFGAGIKGKLTEAMQCGTPNVTTNIGAESMHEKFDWSGVVANSAEKIASAAVELYSDSVKWQKAQDNGFIIINKIYDKSVLGIGLLNAISRTQNNIQQHRLQNFIGSVLMHHSLASTKYMAKWIEAKNKK